MANEIYENSWWGSPVKNGWGSIYYDFVTDPLSTRYQDRVLADGGTVEAIDCVANTDLS